MTQCDAEPVNTICFGRFANVHVNGFVVGFGYHLGPLWGPLAPQSFELDVKEGAKKTFPEKRRKQDL